MGDTLGSQTVSTKLQWLAHKASHDPEMTFTSIGHFIDEAFLHEACRLTRKDGAPGIDGVRGRSYLKNEDENIAELHKRLSTGSYVAPSVKRTYIEKEDGKQRPLGLPCFEDKIAQRSVTMLLSAIYEEDFYEFSYGFRQGRSPHQALEALRERVWKNHDSWIVDADVKGYFDSIDHNLLQGMIKKRVKDGKIRRLIGKWLKAGVLEDEELYYPESGTPQGGVISPLLANIYLHHVLDEWFVEEIQPRLKGRSMIIRFADDFIIGCEYEEDARRILAVLPKRFERFNLTIHPEKTRLIEFKSAPRCQSGEAHTFDFLGFMHYWGKSRKGKWTIKRRTSQKRLRRAIKSIWRWCKYNRHMKLADQRRILKSKLRGHYQYYGLTGNYKQLEVYYESVRKAWHKWLGRRSRDGSISWDKFEWWLKIYPLPTPKVVHSIYK